MLYVPSIFGENLMDDFMGSFMDGFDEPAYSQKKNPLYGKNAARIMKTDITEKEEGFVLDVDLPGYKKDEIRLELENGVLTISAEKGLDKEEKNEKDKVIRRERYFGKMARSFYVGEDITETDIRAKFEDGVLQLFVPKKAPAIPEKKTISIEG